MRSGLLMLMGNAKHGAFYWILDLIVSLGSASQVLFLLIVLSKITHHHSK